MNRRSGLLKPHGELISFSVRIMDLLILTVFGWLAYGLRFGLTALSDMPANYVACLFGGVLIAAFVLPLGGLYRSWRGAYSIRVAAHAVLGWSLAFAVLLLVLWATHASEEFSRLWLGFWGIMSALGLAAVRYCTYLLLSWARRRGFNTRRVLVFGAGDLGQRVVDAIQAREWTGFHPACVMDDDPDREGQHISGGLETRTDTDNLAAIIAEQDIDEVWLALPLRAERRVRELTHVLRNQTVNIRLMPDVFGLRLLNYSVTDIAGIGTLNLTTTPLQGWNRVIKAAEDKMLGAVIALLLLPLLLAIALGILVTMGRPVLFRQKRHGWDGRPFTIYKFRSMQDAGDASEVHQATRNDPRITALGRLLRKTSMDELPQLINVMKGDMSLVGPRPHALEHNAYYSEHVDQYMKRHCVKPGITGWAQINGLRGGTETVTKMKKRVDLDLYYIDNWSLTFDIRILVATFRTGLIHANAY